MTTTSEGGFSGTFRDRRSGRDRRQRDSLLHDMGRRRGDRRHGSEKFSPRPWWLRVNYLVGESTLRATAKDNNSKD
jgi:hypothetical protein